MKTKRICECGKPLWKRTRGNLCAACAARARKEGNTGVSNKKVTLLDGREIELSYIEYRIAEAIVRGGSPQTIATILSKIPKVAERWKNPETIQALALGLDTANPEFPLVLDALQKQLGKSLRAQLTRVVQMCLTSAVDGGIEKSEMPKLDKLMFYANQLSLGDDAPPDSTLDDGLQVAQVLAPVVKAGPRPPG